MNFNLDLDNIALPLRGLYYIFILCVTIFFLGSCSIGDKLHKGEYLLYSQKIKGAKKLSSEELSEILKQRPNRKILGLRPYLYIYYFGKRFFDSAAVADKTKQIKEEFDKKIADAKTEKSKNKLTKKKDKKLEKQEIKQKEGNWIMRVPGEPPSLFDSTNTANNANQLNFFLKSKGFFQGSVQTKVDTFGHNVSVVYQIKEGTGYKIKELHYKIIDKTIDSIVQANKSGSPIAVGKRYDEASLTAERDRVNTLLRNTGYYNFNRQYIFFDVDTSIAPYTAYINVVIENPPKGGKHEQSRISRVIFDADATVSNSEKTDTTIHRGTEMLLLGKRYSKRIINQKITIDPGSLFNQYNIQLTQRNLASMDMFKFANINFERDNKDSSGKSLICYIRTSPLKKYQLTSEVGLTVSSLGFVPGPFGNVTIKNRNIFGRFEIFEATVKAGIEGYASFSNPNVIFRTQELTGNLSLTFPEFLFPFKSVRRKFKDKSPRSKLLSGATLVNRPEYDRFNIKTSFTYYWLKGQYSMYQFSILDANVINTLRTSQEFEEYLETLYQQGNNLKYSFNNSFVSNLNFSYTINNNEFGANKKSRFLKLYLESGGTIFNIRPIAPNDSIFGLKTYRYAKGNLDLRYYFPTSLKSNFVIRFNVGLALPYDETQVLPYEKNFFAGGSNSIRAWDPRRLGPGTYAERDSAGKITYKHEQPGQLLLESNYEYRFNIIRFLDGAVFVDAGNLWTVRKDNYRPGSQFSKNFYKEVAVGTGFGLRLNFSFLILRFDLGIKTYDPAQTDGGRFVLPDFFKKPTIGPRKQGIINFGIGYPF